MNDHKKNSRLGYDRNIFGEIMIYFVYVECVSKLNLATKAFVGAMNANEKRYIYEFPGMNWDWSVVTLKRLAKIYTINVN